MAINIYDFSDYRDYLQEKIVQWKGQKRGVRSKMATEMGCDNSFVSLVLAKKGHFSLEQVNCLQEMLGHTKEERDFFLLLVQFTRAGTSDLRSHFNEKMLELKKNNNKLANRLSANKIAPLNYEQYYKSWVPIAVHILLTIDQVKTKTDVLRLLGIKKEFVEDALITLLNLGLLRKNGDEYEVTKESMHLPADSPFISKHHLNLRLKCIEQITQKNDEDAIHYSSLISLSIEDYIRLRESLIETIKNFKKTVATSKAQTLASFCLDYFKLT